MIQKKAKAFDLFSPEVPLSGRCLIEASAGTGKTYTITGMVVRLVAENIHGAGEDLSNILVVTFTKAATQELKDRIIKRLRECLHVLKQGTVPVDDPFLTDFNQYYRGNPEALSNIKNALHQIDDLSVFTIHAFSQRLIQQYGPQAGIDMADEVITDKQEITSELIYDYWRQALAGAEDQLIWKAKLNILIKDSTTPDAFAKTYSNLISDSTVSFDARLNLEQWEHEIVENQQVFDEVKQDVPKVIEHLRSLFSGKYKLSKTYFKDQKWEHVEQSLRALADQEYYFECDTNLVNTLKYLGFKNIQEKFNKGCTFDHLSLDDKTTRWLKNWQKVFDLYNSFNENSSRVLMSILDELQKRYFNQLDDRQAYTYDDILYTAHQLITDVPAIRHAVRKAYPIGLIDEFQDTDPLQWQLFNWLYEKQYAAKTLLYLIGDPKQSIYKFRGADINAYLMARESINQERIFTLDTNYRSDQGFIEALNHFWGRHDSPFYNQEVPFEPTKSAHGNRSPLSTSWAPLHWVIDRSGDNYLNKNEAQERAAGIAAGCIRNLLEQNREVVESGACKPEDIAVLCGTNKQADLVKNALSVHGLKSVLLNRESVYQSDEAAELLLLLEAVAEPANHARIRAALGTRILSEKKLLLTLNQSGPDDSRIQLAFEEWLLHFQEWHQQWGKNGLMPMLRTVLKKCNGKEHLLSYVNGERRITNINHLMELLREIEKQRPDEMFYLLEQLRRKIRESGDEGSSFQSRSEEEELRLESDRNLIKIVTIHRSKGLEYKVVVAPFLWDGINVSTMNKRKPFVYHDPNDASIKRVDIDGKMYEDSTYRYFEEELADQLRVAYVALTRGIHQNILIHVPYAQNYEDKGHSAYAGIDYVLTGRQRYQKALRKKFASKVDAEQTQWLTYPEVINQIEQLSNESVGAISYQLWDKTTLGDGNVNRDGDAGNGSVANDPVVIPPVDRFTNHYQLKPAWSLASYSSLTRYRAEHEEIMDFSADKMDDPVEEEQGEAGRELEQEDDGNHRKISVFSFPKGAQTGLCWHRIFELISFHQPNTWKEIVQNELASHEFDSRVWGTVILEMVRRTMQKNLLPSQNRTLRLIDLQPDSVSKEMAFHFKFEQANSEMMLEMVRNHARSSESPSNSHQPDLLSGLMKGYIDLTFCHKDKFYILDYKSNHLGSRVEDYHKLALEQSVEESLYDLQYHIYTLALHRYLKERLGEAYSYESHFGGVFYLYLRGIRPQAELISDSELESESEATGIYFDRPEFSTINALNTYLNDG